MQAQNTWRQHVSNLTENATNTTSKYIHDTIILQHSPTVSLNQVTIISHQNYFNNILNHFYDSCIVIFFQINLAYCLPLLKTLQSFLISSSKSLVGHRTNFSFLDWYVWMCSSLCIMDNWKNGFPIKNTPHDIGVAQ